ncbi:hypothetical protein A2630_01500 [Candidatus Woesebacteria bacterium RIFCSPHIGHO2_01_FULL_44_10]|uniref:Uncharacterized protein n=1 Tax=Candidatus Woesebacteria bacterium RIFCSPLOWO2_01_FULL_44_14 TaxID=1802525 RepID=A0A1F8BZZ2_9BACT|nr:MAG: hypothetical protein A2630_01500 [Candidatus Woesebacteria bacterium RIFCSPHIGHO2_01_FULL_44_10]OGM54776.1 MAG: hypothetical protein A3F62_01755 [Candidatus Woesebacteria bacterium RIFCSPHIGHO2_12_FULL_44_11]OGM69681.1 MAG: hypothetical protein A2975_01040 [Candidatus Woesebacteria bacterium RIFCSPLOWO2_01_FULL_44_14]
MGERATTKRSGGEIAWMKGVEIVGTVPRPTGREMPIYNPWGGHLRDGRTTEQVFFGSPSFKEVRVIRKFSSRSNEIGMSVLYMVPTNTYGLLITEHLNKEADEGTFLAAAAEQGISFLVFAGPAETFEHRIDMKKKN